MLMAVALVQRYTCPSMTSAPVATLICRPVPGETAISPAAVAGSL